MATKKEMLQSAKNMEVLFNMKFRKRPDLLQDQDLKEQILANLKKFVEVKESMSYKESKNDLELKFKELLQVSRTLNMILDDTETFKSILSMVK